jgi:hypothetical protein
MKPVGFARLCGLLVLLHMFIRIATRVAKPDAASVLISLGHVSAFTTCAALVTFIAMSWVQNRKRSKRAESYAEG